MGILNLLKANYTGKVGQTVGAKWKDKSTVRTYTKPSNPNTAAQKQTRKGFGDVSTFIATFADQIKMYSSLDVKGMSLRNAIMKINKEMIADGALDKATLLVNKGGLPIPTTVAAEYDDVDKAINFHFDEVTSPVFSDKAIAVGIVVDATGDFASVGVAPVANGGFGVPWAANNGSGASAYLYFIDYRGSTRVGSKSVYKLIA